MSFPLASPLTMTLNLVSSPDEHILFEGVLTDIPLGRIETSQSQVVEIPVCFLSGGHFEIGAEARILGASEESGRAGVSRLRAMVREDG